MPPGMGQLESLLPSSTSSSACMCVRMGTRCSQASFPCVPELQHEAPADQVMVQLHNSCAVYGAGQRVSACMLTNLWGNRHPTVQSPAVNLPADVLAQYLEHIDNDLPQVFPDLPDMLRHTAPDVLQQAAQEPPVVHLPCPCSQYEAPGADLHQQLCKTQKHADLGERAGVQVQMPSQDGKQRVLMSEILRCCASALHSLCLSLHNARTHMSNDHSTTADINYQDWWQIARC